MEIEIHQINNIKVAEVIAENILIASAEDVLDLLGSLYFQDVDKIILHEKNITPDFFDLKNGIAGELLQKFSNYRVRLAIVGDFSFHKSKSMQDFIFESNKLGKINFVATQPEAINRLLNS